MNGREEKPFLLIKVCPFTSLLSLSLSFISIWSYFLCLGLPKHCFSVVLLFQPHGCVSVKLLRLQPKTLWLQHCKRSSFINRCIANKEKYFCIFVELCLIPLHKKSHVNTIFCLLAKSIIIIRHCHTTSHSTTPHPMNGARMWYTVFTILYDLFYWLRHF